MTSEGRCVIAVRHGDEPDDDRVTSHLRAAGYRIVPVRPFAGEAIPAIDGATAGVVVFGGGFDAFGHDRFPFLAAEARLIETGLANNLPVLGICQGAQQIAHVLGATVGPPESGMTEFGYYEIRPTPDADDFLTAPLVVAQSHFHGFGIPAGAIRLAESDLFANQAFRFGSALALQFHPEVTIAGFRRWQEAPWARYGQPGAQERSEQDCLMAGHDVRQAEWFSGVLDAMFPHAADR